MEIRKLQLIGGSSYMVSLPKKWIKSNDLVQGDELILSVDGDYIVIRPKKSSKGSTIERAVIKKIPKYDEKFLLKFVYALYVQGLDEIIIEDKALSPRVITKIGEIVRRLIGMEIIDATDNSITLRCLTTPDFDVEGVLRRMGQIVKGMLECIEDGIRLKDPDELKTVFQLEEDSDRFYLLAVRLENRIIKEMSSPSRLDELEMFIGERMVAKQLEEIADLLRDLSQHIMDNMDEDSIGEIPITVRELNYVFNKAFQAYMNCDIGMAEESIRMLECIINDLCRIKNDFADNVVLCICKQIKSIGEVAFNRAVGEMLNYDARKE
jgi:phosphate uptake regulator